MKHREIVNIWDFDFIEHGDLTEAAKRLGKPLSTVHNEVRGEVRKGSEECKAVLLAINHERQQRIKSLLFQETE